jgi:hypothetical protein
MTGIATLCPYVCIAHIVGQCLQWVSLTGVAWGKEDHGSAFLAFPPLQSASQIITLRSRCLTLHSRITTMTHSIT